MMRKVAYTMFTVLLFLGCGSAINNATPYGPDIINSVALRNFLRNHPMNCPEEQLAYRYVGDRIHSLDGCNNSVRFTAIFLRQQNYSRFAVVDELSERFSFETNCAQDEILIRSFNPRSWGVEGCGQRATYVLVDRQNDQFMMDWILNSETIQQ